MAILKPFCAIRPKNEYADDVLSLPYDVMNRKEATEAAKDNGKSFLHICRSEIDLPQVEDPYSQIVYQKAKSNMAEFLAEEILKRDEKPMLYVYRQRMDGRVQTGIVGCVSVDDYEHNVIKKHEFTRVEKELDRINHFDVCNANTEPVFLTYRRDKRVNVIIDSYINSHDAQFDFVAKDGVGHALWAIEEDHIVSTLCDLFKNIDSLYIADGHHRSASAVKVGKKRREEYPEYKGDEEFNFFMAVIFPDEDLKIFDYNRVVKDLNGLTKEEFLRKLEEKFTLRNCKASPFRPKKKHSFGMFLDDEWYEMNAKEGILDEQDVIASLDVSVLQEQVLAPILGIHDPRTDKRIDFVGGIRGLEGLEKRVKEDMKVAFALYPVDIADLLSVSDAGLVMPPKSTWFEPKLGSGLFIHEL